MFLYLNQFYVNFMYEICDLLHVYNYDWTINK